MSNAPSARRVRFHVSYDGSEYHGWQVQPGLPTIQGELERILSEIESAPVKVEASGRTDAGVHALEQVAACSLTNPIPVVNLVKAVNRLLPRDIRIFNACEASPEFHPRFDATSKVYEYRILRSDICSPFERRYVLHHPYPLHERGMVEMAPLFEGEHDFTAFAAADEKDALGRSKVRRIFESVFARENDRMIYRVRGSGFLKHMVRNMVGVLLEVGKGNVSREDFLSRLVADSGIAPGPTVPASGLFLVRVEY